MTLEEERGSALKKFNRVLDRIGAIELDIMIYAIISGLSEMPIVLVYHYNHSKLTAILCMVCSLAIALIIMRYVPRLIKFIKLIM